MPLSFIEQVGRNTTNLMAAFGDFWMFVWRTFKNIGPTFVHWKRLKSVLPQMYDVGTKSVPVVSITGAFIGMVLAVRDIPDEVRRCLVEVQHKLFDLGGELATPGYRAITQADIDWLEQQLDGFNDLLPPLKEFILPGGGPAAGACHLARTITRRAERTTWTLAKRDAVPAEITMYLNRLSDLLFVIARILARYEGGTEVLWRHQR